jgi:NAD(P)-dependent dehydrogenase (short-subunit alcohol dehydrogenase family)
MGNNKTTIVMGASQGIGAAVLRAFPDRGYNAVGSARSLSSESLTPSRRLALVEGDIGLATTAEKIAQTASKRSAAECSHSWTGWSCPECEERSYLKVLVAELLYRNQVLRFDLIQAREHIEHVGDADRQAGTDDLKVTFQAQGE